MKKMVVLAFLTFAFLAAPAVAQTTTYTFPSTACVTPTNCILYGPAEDFSLWTTSTWSIFNVFNWSTGVAEVSASYYCTNPGYSYLVQKPSPTPMPLPKYPAPSGPQVLLTVTCSGVNFLMNYTVHYYPYATHVGTRYWILGASLTIAP